MNSNQINWPTYLNPIKKMIRPFPIPYVTALANSISNKHQRAFAVLIATIISLRTKDQTTKDASERILKLANTPEKLVKLSVNQIEKAIYPAGFYRVKAKNIKEICKILIKDYQSKVPQDIETMIKFPGVGRKTANLVMTEGFRSDGICVDVHVHRILNRIGLIKTKTPDETEMVLRDLLPRKFWQPINFWLVTFGQNHCKPVRPKCDQCLLSDKCAYNHLN